MIMDLKEEWTALGKLAFTHWCVQCTSPWINGGSRKSIRIEVVSLFQQLLQDLLHAVQIVAEIHLFFNSVVA